MSRIALILILALALVTLGSCGKKVTDPKPPPPPPPPGANTVFGGVTISGAAGQYVTGDVTDGASAAPTVEVAGEAIRGTSLLVRARSDAAMTSLVIGVDDARGGYFEAPIPEAQQHDVSAVIELLDASERTSIPLRVLARTSTGITRSAVSTVGVNAIAGHSDILQFSLNWSAPVDLDLHVRTPGGEDIFYAHERGSEGGELDLDSNAGCDIDNVDNENITWKQTVPASGTYTAAVDLWSACDVTEPVPYVLTVRSCDGEHRYNGVALPGNADHGGNGAGDVIASTDFGGASDRFVLTVARELQNQSCTSGYLLVNDAAVCYTLERPWANNAQNISSIPAGTYCAHLRYDHADHWRVQLDNVPGRTDVQIHIGNQPNQSIGCILVGDRIAGDLCHLIDSASAYAKLKTAFYGTSTPVSTPDKDIYVQVMDAGAPQPVARTGAALSATARFKLSHAK